MTQSLSSTPVASHPTVLFVEDDPDVFKSAALALQRRGLRLLAAREPGEAWSVLAAQAVDVILLDLNFAPGAVSGAEGQRFLEALMSHDPDAVVVVVTGHSGINIAVAAMRAGAADFVMKPWSNARLGDTVEGAVALRRARLASRGAPAPGGPGEDGALVGDSAAMARVRHLVRRIAPTEAAALILGEPGSGKSRIAVAIHRQSPRALSPFVRLDLGTPEADLEAAFMRAQAGTVLLDEIGALDGAAQARLLSVLERRPEVRVLSSSRRTHEALSAEGGVRDDLLCRLDTVLIAAPPLRERTGDAVLLARHALRRFEDRHRKPARALGPGLAEAIAAHPWPGNIRGLEQAMERLVLLSEGTRYEVADLAPSSDPPAERAAANEGFSLARAERALVAAALQRHGFNVSHAARDLGLTRAALYRRMAKHGL